MATKSATVRRPRRLSRAESKARTRDLLLDAAERVFARRGFFAASVDEVAEEAGFSKGAVYSNFASKDEVFLAMVERHIEERVARIEAVADAVRGDAEAESQRVGEAFIEILDEERDWLVLMLEFWACAARSPELQKDFSSAYRRMRSAVAELIERRAREDGAELPLSADVVAAATFAMGNGVALERLADPKGVPDGLFGIMLARFFGSPAGQARTERSPRAAAR